MPEWEGFTESDLQKLQSNPNRGHGAKITKPISARRLQSSNKTASNKLSTSAKKVSSGKADVPLGALLSQPPKPAVKSKSMTEKNEIQQASKSRSSSEGADSTRDHIPCVIDDVEAIQKKEKIKLEDVHVRQKQMEEKNRRKRAMLTKEIAERKKKALAESSKLVKIQAELVKLDQLLNCDVSILRDKIDDTCMEFSVAQKRFEKAEAEYIKAKMELHTKTVQKEDLTEHLFNLIQANEERKAKKLEELMQKLDVEEAELEEKEMHRKEKEHEKEKDNPPDDPSSKSSEATDEHGDSTKIEESTNASKSEQGGSNPSSSDQTNIDVTKKVAEKAALDANGDNLHGATSSEAVTVSGLK